MFEVKPAQDIKSSIQITLHDPLYEYYLINLLLC